jgi:hypothetical protein
MGAGPVIGAGPVMGGGEPGGRRVAIADSAARGDAPTPGILGALGIRPPRPLLRIIPNSAAPRPPAPSSAPGPMLSTSNPPGAYAPLLTSGMAGLTLGGSEVAGATLSGAAWMLGADPVETGVVMGSLLALAVSALLLTGSFLGCERVEAVFSVLVGAPRVAGTERAWVCGGV